MAYSDRYAKPNLTNLPSELGKGIFKQILSTPRPDYSKMQAEAIALEKEMIRIRENEDAERNSAN